MNGVAALRSLLVGSADLAATVPSARIRAGVLPQGTVLPAIALLGVSATDRNILLPGERRMVTERVQVTVLADNYPALKAVQRLVKRAAADQMPTVPGILDVVVLTDGQGPDFFDETSTIYLGTQDFKVTFNEET